MFNRRTGNGGVVDVESMETGANGWTDELVVSASFSFFVSVLPAELKGGAEEWART